MIYYFSLYAKILAGELNSDLKGNLNEQTIINKTCDTHLTEYYITDVSKYISFSINISFIEISRFILRIHF